MSNCDRCGQGRKIARDNMAFGYETLCVDCYCLLIYGRTNNPDPTDVTPKNTHQLHEFEI